jgi:Centromere DNA-binding protein complex CBF3 subunit, domain 2
VADFEPDYPLNYFIPRETVKPARSLRQRVWPQLDRWRQAHLGLPGATEAVEPNLAAGGFLELLDKLRDVFLQDSVFVRRDHPDHPLFRDVLFTGPEYASFATAVLAAADTLRHEDPHLVAIEKAIPSVNERLWSMTGVIQTGQAAHVVSLAQIRSSLDELTRKLDDFLTGSFSLTFTPGRSRMLPQGYDLATGQPRRQTPPSPLDLA